MKSAPFARSLDRWGRHLSSGSGFLDNRLDRRNEKEYQAHVDV